MGNTSNVNVPLELFQFARQEELALFAADAIIKQQFPNLSDLHFRPYDEEKDKDIELFYNETFAIKSQNKDLLSKATLRVSLVKLGANFPEISNKTYKKVKDQMQEFLNQFLGVVNQNLANSLDMIFRIGLPTHIKSGESTDEEILVPGVRIIDSTGTFDVNLGFVRITGSNDIDLSNAEFTLCVDEDDDIDFF